MPETDRSSRDSSCWICGFDQAEPWKERSLKRPLRPEDFQITDSGYGATLALQRCGRCGFIFALGDEVDELTALYEALEDPEYVATQDSRALQMEWLLRRARDLHPEAQTLLDIGAGAGLLTARARDAGLEAVGVEPSRSLVEAGRRVHGVELLQGVYPHPELEGRTFDVVTLVDVIEHVADPVGLLQACRDALAPGGVLIVVTPDVGSLAARLLGHRWWHFRLAHVGYFNRKTFLQAFEAANLKPQRLQRTLWFFRVEYLAERVAEYLPVGWWNRFARKVPPLAWIYRRIIPLNLFDSWLVFARKNETSGDAS